MKKMNARIISLALALLLALTACVPALAAGANRSVMHIVTSDGSNYWLNGAMETEDGIYVFLSGMRSKVLLYQDGAEEPLEYEQPEQNQEMPDEDGAYRNEQTIGWFGWNGAIYELYYQYVNIPETEETSGSSEIVGGLTKKLTLEDGKLTLGESDLPELDWSGMIEDYGDWKSSRYLNTPLLTIDDKLAGICWDNNGNQLMVTFDLTNGEMEEIEMPVGDSSGFTMLDNHTMLMMRYDWSDEVVCHLIRYDLADESEEELSVYRANSNTFTSISGLCVDPATNTLYFARDGEIWAAPEMDLNAAVAVNDCPIAYDINMKIMKDGNLLVYGQNSVMIRGTDPSQRADYSLTVQDYVYCDSFSEATYAFSNGSGVPVILRRGGVSSNILQDMMNREDSVDIYTLQASSSEFDALRNRGFLYDLSSNEKLASTAERLVPYVKDAVTKDGKLVAVPMNAYGSSIGYKTEILKKLGLEEGMPKTWDQFFDWLETLPEKLTEDIKLVEDSQWMDRDAFRSNVRSLIMTQYQIMMDNKGEEDFVFNTPMVNGLLKRLDEVDYDALGVKEADESQQELGGVYYGDDNDPLLQFYYSGTPGDYYSNMYIPLALSLEEGEDPIIPADVEVAILNPFSEHPEEALLYLSLLLKNMGQQDQYTLYTDKTEPIPYAYYEDSMKSCEESLKFLRENLEKAEGDEKTLWETYIRETEDQMEEMDRWGWKISKNAVENYLKVTPLMKVPSHNYMEDILGAMDDEAQEAFYKELDRENDVDKYLNTIDNKLQMVRKEGH